MIDRKKIRDDAFLKEYEGSCPTCGYQLKKPTKNRCPECGSRFGVMLFTPFRFSPWHALLTSFAISIGVILDRVFLTLYGAYKSNGVNFVWGMFLSSLIPLVVLVLIFIVFWKLRNRLKQITLWKRIVWFLVAIIIPIIITYGQLILLLYWA